MLLFQEAIESRINRQFDLINKDVKPDLRIWDIKSPVANDLRVLTDGHPGRVTDDMIKGALEEIFGKPN